MSIFILSSILTCWFLVSSRRARISSVYPIHSLSSVSEMVPSTSQLLSKCVCRIKPECRVAGPIKDKRQNINSQVIAPCPECRMGSKEKSDRKSEYRAGRQSLGFKQEKGK